MRKGLIGLLIATMAGCGGGGGKTGGGKQAATAQLKGAAMPGRNVTDVVALPAAQPGKTARPVRVKIKPDGTFLLPLPRGPRYTVAFESQGRKVGGLAFPVKQGGAPTYVLNLTLEVKLSEELFDLGLLGGSGFDAIWCEASVMP